MLVSNRRSAYGCYVSGLASSDWGSYVTVDLEPLGRVLVISQGKGGVGKTTVVCNVAGLAAVAGVRVLVVDLDPQGNTARDLGYDRTDGKALLNALVSGERPPVLPGVRENLDVVPGGPALADLVGLAFSRMQRGEGIADMLHASLAQIAAGYDLIVIDTPPGDRLIVDGAFAIASNVLIPTRSDEGSIDGVELVAERFVAAKQHNPALRLAGVLLFAVGSRSLSIEREVRAAVKDMLGDSAPVFRTRIRYLEAAPNQARKQGLLIHELEQRTQEYQRERFAALARGETPPSASSLSTVAGLADDLEQLTQEVLQRISELETERVSA